MYRRKKRIPFLKYILLLVFIVIICIVFYNTNIDYILNDSFESNASSHFIPNNSEKLFFYVMSTGNSDCVLIIDPNGYTMLVDAADDEDFYIIKNTLDKYKVSKINMLVATHSHADHIGAMDDIIKSYEVDSVYITEDFLDDSKSVEDMLGAIESSGIPIVHADSGMKFALGDASVNILGPNEGNLNDDANNKSIVLMVSYNQMDFLLTGDMEEEESREILDKWGKNVDCEVLKVAHHGSETGTTRAFLEAASPQIAVISCGKNNPYGHPSEETLSLLDEFGAKTLRTDLMGDIAILTDGMEIEVYEEYKIS